MLFLVSECGKTNSLRLYLIISLKWFTLLFVAGLSLSDSSISLFQLCFKCIDSGMRSFSSWQRAPQCHHSVSHGTMCKIGIWKCNVTLLACLQSWSCLDAMCLLVAQCGLPKPGVAASGLPKALVVFCLVAASVPILLEMAHRRHCDLTLLV